MRASAKSRWVALGAVAGAMVVALVVPFWPHALGGSTTYVANRGDSMKPRVSSGDLTLLRKADSYRVGDVAAYRNAALHRVVVHRIVEIDGDRYTFKGDANTFLDPQQVTGAEIVGRLSARIPKVGSMLLWLVHPFNAVLLALFIAMVVWNRARLRELVAAPKAAEQPSGPSLKLDDDRVVRISDMSFPHELAVADVVGAESMMRLAKRYDRPVLYDEAQATLFVVESSMLFRCELTAAPATSAQVLSMVPEPELIGEREPVQEPAPVTVLPIRTPAPKPAAPPAAVVEDRPARHRWPTERPTYGRRRPSPLGRDWRYDRTV